MNTKLQAAGLLTMTDAAKALGIPLPTFHKRVQRGWLSKTTHSIGGRRRYYTETDLEKLRDELAHLSEKRSGGQQPHIVYGHWNIAQAARKLNMPEVTLRRWLSSGIPRPSHSVTGHLEKFYSDADLKAIQKTRRDYFLRRLKLL